MHLREPLFGSQVFDPLAASCSLQPCTPRRRYTPPSPHDDFHVRGTLCILHASARTPIQNRISHCMNTRSLPCQRLRHGHQPVRVRPLHRPTNRPIQLLKEANCYSSIFTVSSFQRREQLPLQVAAPAFCASRHV